MILPIFAGYAPGMRGLLGALLVVTGCGSGSMSTGTVDAGQPDAFVLLVDAGPSGERQTKRPVGTTGAAVGYLEYLPPGYGNGARFPLLVFHHGIGENGDGSEASLESVSNIGPAGLIKTNQWPNDRPFIVLSPQHPGGGCPGADEIKDFITYAAAEYDVDPTRIYLTGLSCGAIGSWGYLGQYVDDEQIAAAVLIAGDGNGAWAAQGCDLGKVAIWGIHGDADGTVSVSGTIGPMDHLINECPSPPRADAVKTIYPGVGHDSWSATYNLSAGHDIYSWMLQHTNQ
jgi:predicted peptidase